MGGHEKYELLLRTYFDPFTTNGNIYDELESTGEVSLVFEMTKASNRINLHMDLNVELTDLNIQATNELNGQKLQVVSHNYLRNQLYEIVFINELPLGQYRVLMKFKSQTSKENGLFKVSYLENYTDRTMLVNNFLPNKARHVL